MSMQINSLTEKKKNSEIVKSESRAILKEVTSITFIETVSK